MRCLEWSVGNESKQLCKGGSDTYVCLMTYLICLHIQVTHQLLCTVSHWLSSADAVYTKCERDIICKQTNCLTLSGVPLYYSHLDIYSIHIIHIISSF